MLSRLRCGQLHRAWSPPSLCFIPGPQARAFLGFGEKSQEETYAEETRAVVAQMRVCGAGPPGELCLGSEGACAERTVLSRTALAGSALRLPLCVLLLV